MSYILISIGWALGAVSTYFYIQRSFREPLCILPMAMVWPITLPIGLIITRVELKEREEKLARIRDITERVAHQHLNMKEW